MKTKCPFFTVDIRDQLTTGHPEVNSWRFLKTSCILFNGYRMGVMELKSSINIYIYMVFRLVVVIKY